MSRAEQRLAAMVGQDEPGLAVSITHRGVQVLEFVGGFADLESRRPWTPQTPAALASHTKCITAYLLNRLHQAGRLDLDGSLAAYLEPLPWSWAPVTLRHCLTNTSGLPFDEQLAWLMGRDWRTPTCEAWLYEIAAKSPLRAPPGRTYLYNDLNWRLAVRSAEAATGQTFEQLCQTWVFAPHGLADTSIQRWGAAATDGKASTYAFDGARCVRHTPYMQLSGDGAAVSTLTDLTRWAQVLLEGAVKSDPTITAMTQRPPTQSGLNAPYAMGLQVGRHRGVDWFGHSGAGAGHTMVWVAPEAELTVVVLSNRADVEPLRTALNVADDWLDTGKPAFGRAAFAHSQTNEVLELADPTLPVQARLERRGSQVRIDTHGDFAWLRSIDARTFETEDGRVSCRLRSPDEGSNRWRLSTGDGEAMLRPVTWRPALPGEGFEGVYRQAELDLMLQIAPDGPALQLRVAGGPDHPWRLSLEACDIDGLLRAGALTLKWRNATGARPASLTLQGRGLGPYVYERSA